MEGTEPRRPKRVIVVDADNPLVEVHGEFFWREDHDQLVTAARNEGWAEGYQRGFADGHRSQPPPGPVPGPVAPYPVVSPPLRPPPSLERRHRSVGGGLLRWLLILFFLTVVFPLLIGALSQALISR
jgi:hypothetical protein